DNTVDITVNDGTSGAFVGTGTLSAGNTFSIVCNGAAGASITVAGTLAGSGTGRTAAGTVAGSFSLSYTATFAHSADLSLFATHYEGFFGGSTSGNLSMDVNGSGVLSGTMTVSQGSAMPTAGTVT